VVRNRNILMAIIFGLLMTGCTNRQTSPAPPITGVPLGSFLAFDADPQFREVPPGKTIPADKWTVLVPRFLNRTRSATSRGEVDWFVLPYEADSRELCEKEASLLTERFDGEGNVALCIRSDGSSSFAADTDLL
jgi:hypothetical protein